MKSVLTDIYFIELTFHIDITFVLNAMIFQAEYPLLFVNNIYRDQIIWKKKTLTLKTLSHLL